MIGSLFTVAHQHKTNFHGLQNKLHQIYYRSTIKVKFESFSLSLSLPLEITVRLFLAAWIESTETLTAKWLRLIFGNSSTSIKYAKNVFQLTSLIRILFEQFLFHQLHLEIVVWEMLRVLMCIPWSIIIMRFHTTFVSGGRFAHKNVGASL